MFPVELCLRYAGWLSPTGIAHKLPPLLHGHPDVLAEQLRQLLRRAHLIGFDFADGNRGAPDLTCQFLLRQIEFPAAMSKPRTKRLRLHLFPSFQMDYRVIYPSLYRKKPYEKAPALL